MNPFVLGASNPLSGSSKKMNPGLAPLVDGMVLNANASRRAKLNWS